MAARKHCINTHFPKDRNCEVCKRTKMTRAPRTSAKQYLGQEKTGDVITAVHKVLNEGGESRNNHRHAVVVQNLATRWIRSHFVQNEVYESFSNRRESRKSFILTVQWNLANHVKNYHGIIEPLQPIDLRHIVLRKERYAKGPLHVTMRKSYVKEVMHPDQLFEVKGGSSQEKNHPQQWWRTFEKFLIEQLDFDQHPMDPCVFFLGALEPLEQGAR